jgi:hypothetical protein
VLRIAGYEREFFITQTPELASMGPMWPLTSTPCASTCAPESDRTIATPDT